MKFIIDILLLLIIALCTWNGYKRGLIGGVAGILAITIALFGGSLISARVAHQVIPALEPFVDGYIDSQSTRDSVLERLGYGESDLSLDDILSQDSSLRYDYAYECMSGMGLHEKRADALAAEAVALADANGLHATEAVVAVLCDTITYVGALVIAFLLILIFLVAIGNVGGINLRLPGAEAVDEVGGAVLGFFKGFLYCVLACWLLSFLGAVIGRETMDKTTLARFFLIFDFITNGLM